ncbi:hypothetical protein RR48_12981 [Papilio machaon]|uniref:Uncharacterized protein n=1 Tax=Papilio machaon TaxID=76193 RepID=A0A194QRX6_PAPMA|nr:hypothetical protein RR48_12981 [Papilio machaon]
MARPVSRSTLTKTKRPQVTQRIGCHPCGSITLPTATRCTPPSLPRQSRVAYSDLTRATSPNRDQVNHLSPLPQQSHVAYRDQCALSLLPSPQSHVAYRDRATYITSSLAEPHRLQRPVSTAFSAFSQSYVAYRDQVTIANSSSTEPCCLQQQGVLCRLCLKRATSPIATVYDLPPQNHVAQ